MTSTCSGSHRLDSTTNTNNAVDDKDDSTNSKNRMGKRKRSLFPQPTKSASTSPKRFLTDTGRLRPKRNHPSHSELPFGGSSDPTAPPPARDRCHDDDNDSRRKSGHGRHFGSNKRLELGHDSHRKTRKRDRGRGDEEKEYDVEKILETRLYGAELQYRAKWLGYKADRTWYYAFGFKKCPGKLREFHDANPASPGPPVRLEEWEKCWEEDMDL
jgi:hypothetical protein